MVDQHLANVVVLGQDILSQTLASDLGAPLLNLPPEQGLYLQYRDNVLGIYPADGRSGGVYVDFVAGKHRHRRLYGGGKSQQIAKAIGIQGKTKPTVLDVTAGLGGDGFVLTSLGCQVTLVERHPIVRVLLQDGLQRLQQTPELLSLAQSLHLAEGSALQVLGSWHLSPPPQVIYLDPMFPHTNKSAQVKKDMVLFRQLVGEDQDAYQLLAPAYDLASHRVVVKRPRLAPHLADKKPTFSLFGKANRFDIYVKASLSSAP